MKGINKIDKIEFSDEGELINIKGHVENIKVVEVNDLDKSFMKHRFSNSTLKNMFWSQFELDYIGG